MRFLGEGATRWTALKAPSTTAERLSTEPRPSQIVSAQSKGPLSRARGQSGEAKKHEVDSRKNLPIHGGVWPVACGCAYLWVSRVCDALSGRAVQCTFRRCGNLRFVQPRRSNAVFGIVLCMAALCGHSCCGNLYCCARPGIANCICIIPVRVSCWCFFRKCQSAV